MRAILTCGTAALTLALGACATQGPQPTEELTRAKTVLEQAEKSDAQRYAPQDLQRAHDELSAAETANSQGHYDLARDDAESAAADADVASARANAHKAQHAAEEVARSNAAIEGTHGQPAPDSATSVPAASPPLQSQPPQ